MAHRKIPAIVAFVFFLVAGFAHSSEAAITFSDPNHQLEIGGHQVGLEFHRGRALPSRISWFAPLANSIDISQDYWTRDSSLVMTVLLDGDTLGLQTESVRWLPSEAQFELTGGGSVSYNFADQPAALLLTITPDPEWNGKTVTVSLVAQLRSSHSYKTFEPARAVADEHGVIAEFPFVDTGYSRLALACAQLEQTGSRTVRRGGVTWLEVDAVAGDSPLLFVLTSGARPAGVDRHQSSDCGVAAV